MFEFGIQLWVLSGKMINISDILQTKEHRLFSCHKWCVQCRMYATFDEESESMMELIVLMILI